MLATNHNFTGKIVDGPTKKLVCLDDAYFSLNIRCILYVERQLGQKQYRITLAPAKSPTYSTLNVLPVLCSEMTGSEQYQKGSSEITFSIRKEVLYTRNSSQVFICDFLGNASEIRRLFH